MKVIKNVTLFFAVILMFSAFFINIIIANAVEKPDYLVLDELEYITFDEKYVGDDVLLYLKKFLGSSNSSAYIKAVGSINPVYQFYGFCGLMRINSKSAVSVFKNMILSESPVKLKKSEKITYSTIGKAITELLTISPSWLIGTTNETFYKETENFVYLAFNKAKERNDSDYKAAILKLSTLHYKNVVAKIHSEIDVDEDFAKKTPEDKLEISKILSTLPKDKRDKALIKLLRETDSQILTNALKSIKEDDSANLGESLQNIMNSSKSLEVKNLAIEKYALIRKKDSIPVIQSMSKKEKNASVLSNLLTQIGKYGSKENSYEFLKLFLSPQYSDDIKIESLKAIIKVTYDTSPNDMFKTMLFIINNVGGKPAIFAINFYIENNISYNSNQILNRLRKYENDEMKTLALKYINRFAIKDGADILEKLKTDANEAIRLEAAKLYEKLAN
ncbi:MAG TPA: hypothetical protein PK385_12800 [Spirochaetota bacterium]|mgnify:FL=1|nr:hypothetical protein [Spirochaetota bacterium]HOS33917.1 hypothetical protein [Spirochaetota bacterium]HOS56921.1 hypothetical protein [Spirochaetota bacterium]HQF78220.1 hypothetical protein [Spirochaetota bacterium]HQH31312.1 hypothetical protein [Spirochaetota bacterium]